MDSTTSGSSYAHTERNISPVSSAIFHRRHDAPSERRNHPRSFSRGDSRSPLLESYRQCSMSRSQSRSRHQDSGGGRRRFEPSGSRSASRSRQSSSRWRQRLRSRSKERRSGRHGNIRHSPRYATGRTTERRQSRSPDMKTDRKHYQRGCDKDQRNYSNRTTPSMHLTGDIGSGSSRREREERRFYSDNRSPRTFSSSSARTPGETLTEPVYDRFGMSRPASESGRAVISAPPKLKKLVDY